MSHGIQGYCFIFVAVLIDVLGAPPIAMPLLIIAGGLAATGKLSFGVVILVASLAAAIGDILWYLLGRNRSSAARRLLERIPSRSKLSLSHSLSWVRDYSFSFLFISRFIPGVTTLATPIAGMAQVPMSKFLLLDVVGRLLWAATVSLMGYSWR
jgi:membrane protein DedA with SNARE-associated domain